MLGMISLFVPNELTIKERIWGMLIVSVPMALITVLSSGFGGADIQLTCVAGFLLGHRRNVTAIIIALFLAAIVGVIFLMINVIKKEMKEKVKLPFVPFLAIGFVFSLFIDDFIL